MKWIKKSENESEEKKPEFQTSLSLCFSLWFLVPEAGIEPALPKEQDFESSASTSSATRAYLRKRIAKVLFFAYLVCV